MSVLGRLHDIFVYDRRVASLVNRIAKLLPEGASVLDVGCGDGAIDSHLMRMRPDVSITGIDVFVRKKTHMSIKPFDGKNIPYEDGSFDVVMFVDMLHHTMDPTTLLREAKRVSRRAIVIKDHIQEGFFDRLTLKLMDYVGNVHHGVSLPYNYWTERQWAETFRALGLKVDGRDDHIGIYPWPATLIFDRSLHFIAKVIRP